jgi:hypothetical protein
MCLIAIWKAFRGSRLLRVVHYSVQNDHLHLIVEIAEGNLANGVRGLCVRIARAINALFERKGMVFSDRYNARSLQSPREVRNALVYVVQNHKKHHLELPLGMAFDPYSSAPYLGPWAASTLAWPRPLTGPPPVVEAETWVLRLGHTKSRPISMNEAPASVGAVGTVGCVVKAEEVDR